MSESRRLLQAVEPPHVLAARKQRVRHKPKAIVAMKEHLLAKPSPEEEPTDDRMSSSDIWELESLKKLDRCITKTESMKQRQAFLDRKRSRCLTAEANDLKRHVEKAKAAKGFPATAVRQRLLRDV